MAIDNRRIRDVRDLVLRLVYMKGAGKPWFAVPEEDVRAELKLTDEEFNAAFMLMFSQDLLPGRGEGFSGTIGLSHRGQAEAEALGPEVLLQEKPDNSPLYINANYSVIQVAGAGSRQSATVSFDLSRIENVLNEIADVLPQLPIEPQLKKQAEGLLVSIRQGLLAKIEKAGLQAMSAALSAILTPAGSGLGKRLAELLGISTS